MAMFDYDLFVIGAGSGGVRASRMAAGKGKKVAVAEELYLGGTCVNVGCVPKKLFVYGSHFADDFHSAPSFGWHIGSSEFDWPTLRDNKTREIERLNGVYQRLLENAGVSIINGRATLLDAHSVKVNGQIYTAERILIAVGGWPFVPDIPGAEYIIDSNQVFYLERFPKRVLVVGGGYIAVEFAGIFNGFGAKTEIAYRGPLFLRGFDQEVREFLANQLDKKGIHLRFNCDVEKITQTSSGLTVFFNDGSTTEVDCVMYATGRKPKTSNLGLENAGVKMDGSGAIVVDDHFQTSVVSIYAIGDVIDRVALTPVALAEGMVLVDYLYGDQSKAIDYANIPSAVFSQPSIGTVGLTQEQAVAKYKTVKVFKTSFKPMKYSLGHTEEKIFMKLLVDGDSDKVIGAHMVGADAGEIIQGLGIAIKAGATKAHFDSTIGIHPTSAEEWVTLREVSEVIQS